MHYYDHALLSAKKFHCNNRLFSHNTWFIQVLTELIGDVVLNTKTGNMMSTRDILFEHCREDHNGKVPSLTDWLGCIRFEIPDIHRPWFNHPRQSDKSLLKQIQKQINPELYETAKSNDDRTL